MYLAFGVDFLADFCYSFVGMKQKSNNLIVLCHEKRFVFCHLDGFADRPAVGTNH